MVTEKARGRHTQVLIGGDVLFLKYPNNLFEAKLFVNFVCFYLFCFLEVFTTVYMLHN